ncbi:SubName: Full=Uncharacterized protein {ECO:0000313/EMBL:CCA69759.1} [Serendipita indica DSM 11827]|nr:SubName: Full=Uncharacterized protein {ECO:0000313/EMBL:CCA69759.1} [Serendipita indica DSM 11827]
MDWGPLNEPSYSDEEMSVPVEGMATAHGSVRSRNRAEQVNLQVLDNQEDLPIVVSKQPPPALLPPGQRWIQIHPSSNEGPLPERITKDVKLPPYWPFKTYFDFEQAELFLKGHASLDQMDAQLKLNWKGQKGQGPQTVRSAKELLAIWDQAIQLDGQQFKRHHIEVQMKGKSFDFSFYTRDILKAIRDLVSNPLLEDAFNFRPERHYVCRDDGGGNDRVWEEYIHGDDFWEIQTAVAAKLGNSAHPLVISLYMDETQLTNFGSNTLWPVYFWIANIPTSMRRSFGPGSAKLLGYLPKVHSNQGVRAADIAHLRNLVFHECFRVILQPLSDLSRFGGVFRTGNGSHLQLVPIIGLRLGDYPEMCRMASIISDGAAACPMGTTPTNEFTQTTIVCPPRDHASEVKAVRNEVGTSSSFDPDMPSTKSYGIRAVESGFAPAINTFFPGCRTFGLDTLHWESQGEYGRTWLPELLNQLTDKLKAALNYQFQKTPQYPDLIHFAQGITSLQWRSGSDHRAISKLIVPILDMILPRDIENRIEILQLFRTLGERSLILHFPIHTSTTLELLREVLESAAEREKPLAINWKVSLRRPKHHMVFSHAIPSIIAKGPSSVTDTGTGEACHRISKGDYKNTNHQTDSFQQQLLDRVLRREALVKIRERVEEQARDESDDESNETNEVSNFRLGSTGRLENLASQLGVLSTLLQPVEWHVLYTQLQQELSQYLYLGIPSLQVHGVRVPRQEHLPDIAGLEGKVSKLVRINSKPTFCEATLTGARKAPDMILA